MKKELETKLLVRNADEFSGKKLVLVNPPSLKSILELQGQFGELVVISNDWALHKLSISASANIYSLDEIEKIDKSFATYILFWSKVKDEAWDFLYHISQKKSEIYIVGGNKSGIKQAFKKLEQEKANVFKVQSANHSQLYKITKFNQSLKSVEVKKFKYEGLTLFTQAGVFSSGRLDKGSEFLLDYLSKNRLALKNKVLDIGAGSGIIGAYLLKSKQANYVLASDSNLNAVKSAKASFQHNNLNGEALASDIFSDIKTADFDLIISNPPFHESFETSSRFIEIFFTEVKDFLAKDGELIIVANIFLPYGRYFEKYFKKWSELTSNSSYRIFWAKK